MMTHEEHLNEIRAVIQRRLLCSRADQADHVILTKGARVRIICPRSDDGNPCLRCNGCGRCNLSAEAARRLVRGFNLRTHEHSTPEPLEAQ